MKIIILVSMLFTLSNCFTGVMYFRTDKMTPIEQQGRIRTSRSTFLMSIDDQMMPMGQVHNWSHYKNFLVSPGDYKLMVHYYKVVGRSVSSSKQALPIGIKINAGETIFICGSTTKTGWFPQPLLIPNDVPDSEPDPSGCN
ncbi:hypothetical protein ND861_09530 [Leptospira sp. 2 VSF19]|uniref:Lipoprotein n=1 Tax=Leptospira soteropolitanensis TaxID=2950025 RepID=A0AAW5VKR7_9LEPT|nr:hypothetical protein [Leptospira soteropolitanensis]MCW7492554.1 hypothetical protein [Leptospira soteropolitanensis]MCW7500602.1 hypothetical protein [Leptospira soteropolitanensis]MCW7522728.1 hypothetical protein [Leptospira soteropolitanensis]MCW7526584.1 hypothetical protein [Leptospira soteropolitanensis]MCW7530572.1 hypothetical protein [Leptospira soteropolitanensis]